MNISPPQNELKDETQWRERHQFVTFAEISKIVPDGSWLQAGRGGTAPDFLKSDNALGVEVTDLLRDNGAAGSPSKQQESIHVSCFQQAIRIASLNSMGLRLIPSFNRGPRIDRERAKELPPIIAALLQAHVPKPGERIYLDRLEHQLPREIVGIRIETAGDASEAQILTADTDNMIAATPEAIQDRISEKNGKVRAYRAMAESLWLLIVIDGNKPSSWIEIGDTALKHLYRSAFERTFILRWREREWLELSCARP